jgi:hypothetical protein
MMMIAIRNFWTRAVANATSSSSFFVGYFVFFWFRDKPVGWQLNYLISNCRAVLSSVLTVSKKYTHTHSLSLTTNQQTYPPSKLSSRYQFHPDSHPPFCHSMLEWVKFGHHFPGSLVRSRLAYRKLREREGERSTGTNKLTRFSRLQAALWHRPFFTSYISPPSSPLARIARIAIPFSFFKF